MGQPVVHFEVMPRLTVGQFTDPEGHLVGLVQGDTRA